MARTATHAATTLALLAALPMLLTACAGFEPSATNTSDRLPTFGWTPPRMRPPSTERPAWLPSLPVDPPRIPAPEHGFRA